MNVNLTPQLEELIGSKVTLGLYTSASEAVHEARDLIDEQDRLRAAKLERCVDRLDEQPGHPTVDGLAGDELAAGLRSFPFGGCVIFHMPMEDGGDVVRVLHSASDGDAAFGEDR
ncbi:MAG TPA: type II toxin-antitoxin system RelE/ParE family toxin [Candidatus Accumulibacter phosphatis]|nr:type II toxin-antitoxin system RelE/ParE family toxin [Candidatus Accumulibacter phosphatis]HRQ95709.1 type II toxin-antitoxin system RelE/ParE family toxin [Candidatus Accumulibacter phosphatis]